METRRLSEANYRKDHTNFGEVYKTTYEVGTITGFYFDKTNPFELDDRCKVKIGSGEHTYVPIFYHCKKNFYSADSGTERPNGALKHAALSFGQEMEVKTMLKENGASYVIGHKDGLPRRCHAIFKIKFNQYAPGLGATDATPFYRHYHAIDQREYCPLANVDTTCVGPDSVKINCTKKAVRLSGSREIQFATTTYYLGDWMIELGPLLLLWQVYAVGYPLPFTGQITFSAAPYTKELREYCIQWGKEKDAILPDQIFNPLPQYTSPAGFYPQSRMTAVLQGQYQGYKAPQPRWILTEFYAQESTY